MDSSTIRFRALGGADLRDAGERELRSVLAQPKRLALLAYLALATPAGCHRRDALLALFWPELDQERARRALRQAVHFLRRTLGAHVVEGLGDAIGLTPESVWCDVQAFREALSHGDVATALALYRGDLLDGFFIADA
ncbi:MAG: AfsR/SARP family transcriptional regulator, partial [Gemmatimonadaceae bacterium]